MSEPDPQLVQRTALLARLAISDADAAPLAADFARILDAFATLTQTDVRGVEAWVGPTSAIAGPLRADLPAAPLDAAELLLRAPEPIDGFYGVPKTIGGGA